ncbi:PREDICTED: glutathione S-transferase T3-like [Camelina sativa]|uniref:Glutathione S-transferase T3-like n=1 Tax=Camelina sativa TaxID=90675 RepID=A0ABM0Y565_CAMSA|nr:PREDICTED: glutathione S-transferase T3-like [Camelina sativa]
MDPSNPYHFWDQNFVDLMNSQENSNRSANTIPPYSTQSSQTIQFSNPFSSQPLNISHPFSSQPLNQTPTSESEDCLDVTADESDEEGGRGIRKRWSAEEDVHLISAWLNTSKDPVVSNEQRKNSFWNRVADYYKAHIGGTSSNKRGTTQCKARWSKINHKVNKFVGCYAQASTRRRSGESEDDVLRMAYEFYKNDMRKPFLLGHFWRELKNDQKWITERHEECGNKRTKLASEGEFAATSSNGGD